jgi:zinc carboxypeptidase
MIGLGLASLVAASCSSGGASAGGEAWRDPAKLPHTRAERTRYAETSHYDDVVAFIDSLRRLGAPIAVGSIGKTSEGRDIPYVIASRPLVSTPDEAKRLGRPIVYVQGNIHAGEVEGKEALQALLRDLVASTRRNALDSIVLIAVPIYNADGNEKFLPQERNRSEQNGPEMVGQRPNAQGLDLNRDYIKADAPETQASLAMFNRWDPDVFVDLHTTDGSYHGYALTYAPSLNQAADVGAFGGGAYARDSLLPVLRQRVRTRHQFEIFDYGNFEGQREGETPSGWYTYDSRPRFGTNYYALRGRIAILSEAYSHDPFDRRVASTYAFTTELLSLVAERSRAILARNRRATETAIAWGRGIGSETPPFPIRSRMTTHPSTGPVVWEELERTGDSTRRVAPGVRRGFRRTGKYHTTQMPVYDRFEPSLAVAIPRVYVLLGTDTAAVRLLRLHGVAVERLTTICGQFPPDGFIVDSAIVSPRPFQNRREVRLEGRWQAPQILSATGLREGAYVVRTAQPLGLLAVYLLEPQSDDGFATWDIAGRATTNASATPVLRVVSGPHPLATGGCPTTPVP